MATQLLNSETDELSTEFESALISIFNRFDLDNDGYLDINELQSFACACNNNAPFDDEALEQIKLFFAEQDKLPAVFLSIRGFKDMYHLQTKSRESDTRTDLVALGFGQDLKPNRQNF